MAVGVIAMESDGTPWRPLVHVLDICEAIARVLEAPQDCVHGEIFNVGGDALNHKLVFTTALARRLHRAAGRRG